MQRQEADAFGVYLHWPFCLSKCPYCDFNSHVRHAAIDETRYVRAFEAEIAATAQRIPGRTVTTMFFGGGLIPKAAIAYAGTFTVGTGLERFYRIGYGLSREERRQVYERAFERGRSIVAEIIEVARFGRRPQVEK